MTPKHGDTDEDWSKEWITVYMLEWAWYPTLNIDKPAYRTTAHADDKDAKRGG